MSDKDEQYKPGVSLWCAEHDHMKRSCPWCENEQLESTIQRLKEELSHVSTSLSLSRVDSKRWREEVERLSNQGEATRLREALERCLVGGNSLASVIIGWNLPGGYDQWTHEQASHYFYNECLIPQQRAYEKYETWLCWKSIMEARDMVEALSFHIEDTEKKVVCPACEGSGFFDGDSGPLCGACDGTGIYMEDTEDTEDTGIQKVREIRQFYVDHGDFSASNVVEEVLHALGITIPGITDGGEEPDKES